MHLDPLTLTLRHVEKVGVPHLRPPALVDLIRELSAVADIKYLSLFIYLSIFIYTRIYKKKQSYKTEKAYKTRRNLIKKEKL